MKVRVRPRDCTAYPWVVETLHPENNRWITCTIHGTYWFAALKAWLLSKRTTEVYMSRKDKKKEFLNKLGGKND